MRINITRENVVNIVRHPTTQKVAIGAVGFGGGLLVGYILGKHREPTPPDPRGKEELEEITQGLAEMRARRLAREAAVVEEENYRRIAARQVGDEVEMEEGDTGKVIAVIEPQPEEEESEPVKRNVFADTATEDDDWNYEAELRNRDSTTPYVIHKDEFYAEEMGFSQHTYTYYNGDDILADEDDKPIYNYPDTVGELKFGHGSGDANVVYIRNEKRKEEYEIVRSDSLFSVDVLGLEIERNERARGLEHSTPRKFKAQE